MPPTTVRNFFTPSQVAKNPRPLFLVPISAGSPSPADDYQSELELNEYLLKHPDQTFFVTVDGDSMIDDGIHPGDLLVVDRAVEPRERDVIIAFIDGDFTVKRFSQRGGKLFLIPSNKKYKPRQVKDECGFEVWGVVTHVIHGLRAT